MIIYKIKLLEQAEKEILSIKKSDKLAYKKFKSLVKELVKHPYTGMGHVEPLRGNYSGYYSRRITKKYRMIYQVQEEIITRVNALKF